MDQPQPKPQAPHIRNILWSAEEAAVLFGVHPITVFRWIAKGRVDSVKVGGLRLIPHAAIHKFFAEALANADTRAATIALLDGHAAAMGKPPLDFDASAAPDMVAERVGATA